MTDNKNTILAIVLSALVLIGWQYFFTGPQEKARQEQLQAQLQKNAPTAGQPGQPVGAPPQNGAPQVPRQPSAPAHSTPGNPAAALAGPPPLPRPTGSIPGAIALKGRRSPRLALGKIR